MVKFSKSIEEAVANHSGAMEFRDHFKNGASSKTMRYIILFSVFVFCCFPAHSQTKTECEKYFEGYIPENLDDALFYLNCKWSEENKEEFRNENERSAVGKLHHGTGMGIRNAWKLWAEEKNSLVKYFNSLGIIHPDDMSSIILTSFHRQLNNVDIDLDTQIERYKKYWAGVEEKKLVNKKIYDLILIGDTIKLPFGTMFKFGKTIQLSFFNYSYQGDAGCIITGIVDNKSEEKGNYILTVKFIDKWFRDENDYEFDELSLKTNLPPIRVGDLFEYDMTYSKPPLGR